MAQRTKNRSTKMVTKDQKFERSEPEQTFIQTERDDLANENETLFDDDGTMAIRGLSYGKPPTVPQDPNVLAGRLDADQVSFIASGGFDRVQHNLRRTPRRYTVISMSAAVTLVPSGKAWNDSDIYLTSSGAADVVLEIA